MTDEPSPHPPSIERATQDAPKPQVPPELVDQIQEIGGLDREPANRIAAMFTSFQGPLPPPWITEGYEKIVPGSTDRIMRAFEEESAHRREMERMALEANIAEQKRNGQMRTRGLDAEIADQVASRTAEHRGQNRGFWLCALAILSGVACYYFEPGLSGAVTASLLGGGGLASLAVVFVKGRSTVDDKRTDA